MTSRLQRPIRSALRQSERATATVVNARNGKATVRLSKGGSTLTGISVIGGPIIAGQSVDIDYSSGKPQVIAYSPGSGISGGLLSGKAGGTGFDQNFWNLAGWSIDDSAVISHDSGNIRFNPTKPAIELGAATGFATGGAGAWLGKDSTVYKFRVGNLPTGDHPSNCLYWDGNTLYVSGSVEGVIVDTTSDTFEINSDNQDVTAKLIFGRTTPGDVSLDYLGSSFVFNESGLDIDVRFEGDTDANTFYLDAGNNRVGIGLSNPATKLEARATSNQIRASYDDTHYFNISVNSSGDVSLTPTATLDFKGTGLSYTGSGPVAITPTGGTDTITLTGDSVTINPSTTVSITPTSTITLTGNGVTVNPTGTVSITPGTTVTITGTGVTINPSAGNVNLNPTGNVELNGTGDIVFDPAGNDAYPLNNYDINLGALNKKWLALYAAELWVETLVAQNVMATIGGRILVGPTTELVKDLPGNLLLNEGFETAGGGGADVFANWVETAGSGGGAITRDGTTYQSGSYSCRLTAGTTVSTIYQDVTTTACATYQLVFWARGNGTGGGSYRIYDNSNNAAIVAWTGVTTGTSFVRYNVTFTAPTGCTSVGIHFRSPATAATNAWFDTTALETTEVWVKHNQMVRLDVGYMETNSLVEFVKIDALNATSDATLNTFTIAGDHTARFPYRGTFYVSSGITGSTGTWTVNSVTYTAPNTVITTLEDVTGIGGANNYIDWARPDPTKDEYCYVNIDRDYESSGYIHAWYAGSALFNTGYTGDGFIDIYSISGIADGSASGPTIVGNVRTGTGYNAWIEHWAIGNLDQLYGMTDKYGVGLGRYSSGYNNIVITVDDTNSGILFRNYQTTIASWINSDITLGDTNGGEYVKILSTGIEMYAGGTKYVDLNTSGKLTAGVSTGRHTETDGNGFRVYETDGTTIAMILDANYLGVGCTSEAESMIRCKQVTTSAGRTEAIWAENLFTGAGQAASKIGVVGYSEWDSNASGTLESVIGVEGMALHMAGAGTITNLTGVHGQIAVATGGTVTNAHVFRADFDQGQTGTPANLYGFYCEDFSGEGTATWAFYSAGANLDSKFEGGLSLGTSAASNAGSLRGTGDLMMDGGLSLGDDSYSPSAGTIQLHYVASVNPQVSFYNGGTVLCEIIGNATTGDMELSVGGASDIYTFSINAVQEMSLASTGMIVTNDGRFGGGLYVGSTASDPTDGDIIVTSDGRFGGGLYVGSTGTLPAVGNIIATSKIFINETANGFSAIGLTVNQGANDDEIMALKSSDVGHTMTSFSDADTFGSFRKVEALAGGLNVIGLKDSGGVAGLALGLLGMLGEASDTTKSTAGVGIAQVRSYVTDGGTGYTAPAANANLFAVGSAGNTRFIVDQEGDIHMDGTSTTQAWDEYDDVKLLTGYRVSVMPKSSQLRDEFQDWIDYAKPVLESTGVVTYNDDGHHFVSYKGMMGLQIDAIRQLYSRLQKTEDLLEKATQRLHLLEAGKDTA